MPKENPLNGSSHGHSAPPDELLEVDFQKDGQRYTFRFAPGQERAVFEALVALAEDPAYNLDWFDAAMLSHRMGPHVQSHLQHFSS